MPTVAQLHHIEALRRYFETSFFHVRGPCISQTFALHFERVFGTGHLYGGASVCGTDIYGLVQCYAML